MQYKYSEKANQEDFASGRVIYGEAGIPNFPVRLLNEIFGRAMEHAKKKKDLSIYDPCCGGGYSLTVLGFCHGEVISTLYGSDIDPKMTACARKNTSLLTTEGLEKRRQEVEKLYQEYNKTSHKEALESIERLQSRLKDTLAIEIFEADCTKELPEIPADIILTDVPYGNLVEWSEDSAVSLHDMMEQLGVMAKPGTVLAVCMDKKQKVVHPDWKRVEKQQIGRASCRERV